MKKISMLLLLGISIFLSSCTATQQQFSINSLLTVAEVSTLKRQYTSIVTMISANTTKFTADELRDLTSVQASIALLIAKIDNVNNIQFGTVTISDISYMWNLASGSYLTARKIVQAHWSEFTLAEQTMLESFDQHAISANSKLTILLNDPQAQHIDNMITIITSLASISASVALAL